MTVEDGDALFGRDGTGGDVLGGLGPDAVGPLPGVELPVVRLPVIGLDGKLTGLAAFEEDLARPGVPLEFVPAPMIGGSEPGAVPSTAECAKPAITVDGAAGRDVVITGPEPAAVPAPAERSQPAITEARPRSTTERAGARSQMGHRSRAPSDLEPWPTAAQRAAARAARSGVVTSPQPESGVTPVVPPRTAPESLVPAPAAPLPARPRIEDDSGLLGITRRSNSHVGSRLFTLFFVFVFVVIAVQLVVALLEG